MTQPTFTQVRAALAAQLSAQIPGLRATAERVAQINPPAAVVLPATGTVVSYKQTMDGSVDLFLRVIVLVSMADSPMGQDLLDAYLSPTGAQSVYAAVQSDPTLGRTVFFADVWEASGYALLNWGGIDYLGSTFTVRAST